MGQIHPQIQIDLGLNETDYVTYATINVDTISSLPKKSPSSDFETLQDQIIWRDFSFVLDKTSSYDMLWAAIKKVEEIKDIHVFDLYAGDKIESGKKSCAFSTKIV
jgi:phenylalanyl-tRNA synthetase beta chain